jgi:predicted nuclease of predicted toxin-antitoxin system
MHFLLDENVPMAAAEMLFERGHRAEFIRDYVPPGSPDALVATVAEELKAVLISFDGDFEKIAPRIPHGERARFRRLSRIWMRCGEPQAAKRLEDALDLIVSEHSRVRPGAPMRMWITKGYLRTDR